MEEKDKFIHYRGIKHIPIKSTIYNNIKYVFAINYTNPKDVKLLACHNKIEEVDDIELIKIILTEI